MGTYGIPYEQAKKKQARPRKKQTGSTTLNIGNGLRKLINKSKDSCFCRFLKTSKVAGKDVNLQTNAMKKFTMKTKFVEYIEFGSGSLP